MSWLPIALQVAGAAMAVAGAYNQSQATKQTYATQAQVQANNAKVAEWQAQDTIKQGQTEEQNVRLRTSLVKGQQRAGLAASGLDLESGSALDILVGTDYMGARDALTVRDNAAKQAWALRNQSADALANSSLLQSRSNAESPLFNAGGTFLTGAASVADKWQTGYKLGTISAKPWWL